MTKDEYKAKHGPWAEVYTHVAPDGANLTIAILELRKQIAEHKLRAELVTVDDREVNRFIRDRVIDHRRIEELADLMIKNRKMFEPVLVCVRPDQHNTAFICDGHHRYVLAHCLGQKHIAAIICYPALWQQHLITDMEPLTREQLFRAPHPSQLSPWKTDKC